MAAATNQNTNIETASYGMTYLYDAQTLAANPGLADAFFDLYEHPDNFPDPNEREPRANILERVRTGSDDPHTHLIAYHRGAEVKAGLIVEFYPRSACVLLTYIFVDKTCRHKGIAGSLLRDREGLPGLLDLIRKRHGTAVQAVFFETNNPFQTHPDNDSISPSDRLLYFYKLGGKRLDLNYVQPPLEHGLEPVTNLYLCLFPHLTQLGFVVPTGVVMRFLAEFYYSLRPFHDLALTDPGAFARDLEETLKPEGAGWSFAVPELERMYREMLKKQYEQSSGYQYLLELPRLEMPRIRFERAAVALEFVVDETYFEPVGYAGVEAMNGSYCVATHSFETDLFAYSYQSDPPYFTRCYNAPQPVSSVVVRFPKEFEFVSEGRREMFYVLTENAQDAFIDVPLNVYLNFTWFSKSQIRVWHLVLAASQTMPLHEYNIIKLMKTFSGAQEIGSTNLDDDNPAHHIRYRVAGEENDLDLYGLLERLAGIRYRLRETYRVKKDDYGKPVVLFNDQAVGLALDEREEKSGKRFVPGIRALRTGVVQIDTAYSRPYKEEKAAEIVQFQETLQNLYARLNVSESGKKTTDEELQKEYRKHADAEYVFEAYCGITLGIFDFSRMGYEEVSDTLIPRSSSQSSFLTINRGVLSSFGYDDQVLASSWNTIGINPYLLIPSAVLTANDYISRDADFRISTLLESVERGKKGKKEYVLSKLEQTRREVINLLNIDFLPNIFQYPTEQDLYEYGLTHRGVFERNRRTHAKLEQVDNLIEECNQMLNQRYQFLISVAATALAVIQLLAPLSNLLFSNFSEKIKTLLGLEIMGALILSAILFGVFVRWWYKKLGLNKRRIKHD